MADQPEKKHKAPQWEYMVIYCYVDKGIAYAQEFEVPGSGEILRPIAMPYRQQLAAFLNEKGKEGWEVVTATESADINLWQRLIPFTNRTLVVIAKRPCNCD